MVDEWIDISTNNKNVYVFCSITNDQIITIVTFSVASHSPKLTSLFATTDISSLLAPRRDAFWCCRLQCGVKRFNATQCDDAVRWETKQAYIYYHQLTMRMLCGPTKRQTKIIIIKKIIFWTYLQIYFNVMRTNKMHLFVFQSGQFRELKCANVCLLTHLVFRI